MWPAQGGAEMTIRMSNELRDAIASTNDLSVRLYDSQNERAYVVIPEELYERLCALVDTDEVLEPQYAHVGKLLDQTGLGDQLLN